MSAFDAIKPTINEKKPDQDMRAPIVKKEEIKWGKMIAAGSFGEVFFGTCRGVKVAMKKLPPPEDEEELEQILTEMEILIHVRHPSVVLFMGVCVDDDEIVIVQELMDCDLFQYLRKNDVNLVKKVHIAMQIAEGMAWLHGGSPVILHSDLKPENVLMDKAGNAKICDFGLSSVTRTHKIERDGIIGTPLYMGPEALLEEPITKAADVYSFAVVLWAVFNIQEPFSHITDYETLVDSVVYRKERPDISDLVKSSPQLANLMNRMWAPSPDDRPDFSTIVDELKDLVAVTAFPNFPDAQNFWNTKFSGDLEVPYDTFQIGLSEYLGNDPVVYKQQLICIKEVLNLQNDSVHINQFAKLLHWFGNLEADSNGLDIVDRIYELFKEPWFYGPITSKEAQTKLSGKHKRGNFLVRLNTADNSQEQPYRISVAGKKGPLHYIVKNKRSKYEIAVGKDKIVSDPDMHSAIQIAGKVLRLKTAAPGRDHYDALFVEDSSVLNSYMNPENSDSSDDF